MRKTASCKKRRVAKNRTLHDGHLVELALALHESGFGYKRIARKLGLPVTTVRNWLQGKARIGVGA